MLKKSLLLLVLLFGLGFSNVSFAAAFDECADGDNSIIYCNKTKEEAAAEKAAAEKAKKAAAKKVAEVEEANKTIKNKDATVAEKARAQKIIYENSSEYKTLQTAKKSLQKAKAKSIKKKAARKTANDALEQAKKDLEIKKKALGSKPNNSELKTAVTDAETAVTDAETAVTDAETAVTDAETDKNFADSEVKDAEQYNYSGKETLKKAEKAAKEAHVAACAKSGNCIDQATFEIKVDSISPGMNIKSGSTSETINYALGTIIQKLMIGLGSLSLLIMTVGAGYIVLHNGQDELLNKGKSIFMSGIYSMIVALSSYYIIVIVRYLLYA